MTSTNRAVNRTPRSLLGRSVLGAAACAAVAACAGANVTTTATPTVAASAASAPTGARPDPRVGLKPGLWDAGEAIWNLRLVSATRPPEQFVGGINSDLAFLGNYVIQGSFKGYQVWDISNPAKPAIKTAFYCPASQSDVSVYKNLLFVSGEDLSARLDCGAQGVSETVSKDRLRGIRIYDISDITKPRNVGNVQTCRGSHTHTVLVDPKDSATVYVYITGSGPVRSEEELEGCVNASPDKDPRSALFRIEVIKVPVAHPEQAKIVNSPRIFEGLTKPATHGETSADVAANQRMVDSARRAGGFIARINGQEEVAGPNFVREQLDSIVKARGGTGSPTGADSATLRTNFQRIVDALVGASSAGSQPGPTQCHDITVYPAIGLAGGACGGYGLLLDIREVAHPIRIDAAADENMSFWHSATFSNDGTKVLFSDEWGGGSQPRCRDTDKPEWGADAIFTIANGKMTFHSYYKLPAPQTSQENCVAHNGSMIPIPGREVMVQGWYQGGISVFDWTDVKNPKEIAYFDRGPVNPDRLISGGSWSVYWYNGNIVSSEIARGLDIYELLPSGLITQNELDAAKTVQFDYLNAQEQRKMVWPATFALARAYVDQLERSNGLAANRITAVRAELTAAEALTGTARRDALTRTATALTADAAGSSDAAKVRMLASTLTELR
jgi:hypothetical protein